MIWSPLVVRPATVADADGIGRIHTGTWQAAYVGLLPPDFLAGLDRNQSAERWRKRVGSGEGSPITLVAAAGGSVRGFLSAGPSRDADALEGTGEVYAVYVDARAWGSGVGSALMAEALVRLAAAVEPVTVWVLEGNQRAENFYARHAFVADGATQQDVIGGLDVIEHRLLRPASCSAASG